MHRYLLYLEIVGLIDCELMVVLFFACKTV